MKAFFFLSIGAGPKPCVRFALTFSFESHELSIYDAFWAGMFFSYHKTLLSQINKYISGAKDPKSFMLAVLYNAVNTHRGDTIMTVHYDMSQPGWGKKPLDDSSRSDDE